MPVERQLDHQYIEAHDIADRYLKRTLPDSERQRFEEHFADCPECLDRIALAEVFRHSKPHPVTHAPPPRPASPAPQGPLAAILELPRERQLMVLGLAALLVAGVPIAFFSGFLAGSWSRTHEQARQGRVSLVVTPGVAAEGYSVAVTDEGGKVVWARSGIEVPGGKALSIPMSFPQLPPGSYTVTVRARKADGSQSTVSTYSVRKP